MKKLMMFFAMLLFVVGSKDSFSQGIPTAPIPSYQVRVKGYSNFKENFDATKPNPAKEKREINVQIKSVTGTQGCQATVWIYSLDNSTILGPYAVTCAQTLTVPIDDRAWGVLVESEEAVYVDVWINTSLLLKLQGYSSQPDSGTKVIHSKLSKGFSGI